MLMITRTCGCAGCAAGGPPAEQDKSHSGKRRRDGGFAYVQDGFLLDYPSVFCVYIYLCVCVCVCVCVCARARACVCVYVFTYKTDFC